MQCSRRKHNRTEVAEVVTETAKARRTNMIHEILENKMQKLCEIGAEI